MTRAASITCPVTEDKRGGHYTDRAGNKVPCGASSSYMAETGTHWLYRCSKGHLVKVEKPRDDRHKAGLPIEVPPPVHRNAGDTERDAAARVAERAVALRKAVLVLAEAAGPAGIIPAEAVASIEAHETSIRPRLSELCKPTHGSLLTKTKLRRQNSRGNFEVVHVLTKLYDPILHG